MTVKRIQIQQTLQTELAASQERFRQSANPHYKNGSVPRLPYWRYERVNVSAEAHRNAVEKLRSMGNE